MDPVLGTLVGILVLLTVVIVYRRNREDAKSSDDGVVVPPTAPGFNPREPGIVPDLQTEEVAVTKVTKPRKVKLLTDAKLQTMTKAELDTYAADKFGIKLDARKTKANMLVDLKAQHKKL